MIIRQCLKKHITRLIRRPITLLLICLQYLEFFIRLGVKHSCLLIPFHCFFQITLTLGCVC
jgi:hypothetical protein